MYKGFSSRQSKQKEKEPRSVSICLAESKVFSQKTWWYDPDQARARTLERPIWSTTRENKGSWVQLIHQNSVIPAISLGWGRGPWFGNTTQSTRWTSWAAYTAVNCLTSPGCRQGFLVTTTGPVRICFVVLLNSPSRSGSLEIPEYCTKTWREVSSKRIMRGRRRRQFEQKRQQKGKCAHYSQPNVFESSRFSTCDLTVWTKNNTIWKTDNRVVVTLKRMFSEVKPFNFEDEGHSCEDFSGT